METANAGAVQTTAVAIDYIGYVRERLTNLAPATYTRFAADAEVSIRTLYNLRDNKVDPAYGTVLKLYELLKKDEASAQ